MKEPIVPYKFDENKTSIDVYLDSETVLLSQKLMSDLFEKNTDTISLHIKNLFKEKELEENVTTEYFSVVQKEKRKMLF
jgi:hypothetical protein